MNLNLTRKWRSKNFDQIVGQELSVRMLKNSLYLNQFFPVYLFSGQRGCGKTSTARVFASAINCVNLPEFQKNPKSCKLPCLECASCIAMMSGNHPDFIEIDAASHTGVDNVRQIIESSSFMPLMGSKKIYLIDEAHMLSKAAFNAFLKILEEPPSSVIFVLATTNPQKIIDTVRSRCFQLFFKSVGHDKLLGHLQQVCKKEDIAYDDLGLGVIVSESQGSVRDSLNILEQVRFSSGAVTKVAVQNILGHIDDESLLQLFESLLFLSPGDFLVFIKNLRYELFSPQYLWKKIIEITRLAIWVKHGVSPQVCPHYVGQLGKLVKKTSLEHLNYIMQLFYENESVFTKTTEKHALLEMILLQIAKKNNRSDTSGASSAPQKVLLASGDDQEEYETVIEQEEEEEEYEDEEEAKSSALGGEKKVVKEGDGDKSEWDRFLVALDSLEDPLLSSIFKHGTGITFDATTGDLEVTFSKQFTFFKDSLKEAEKLWLPFLKNIYAPNVTFKPVFSGEVVAKSKKSVVTSVVKKENAGDNYPASYSEFKANNKTNNNKKLYKPVHSRVKSNKRGSYGPKGYNNSGKLIDVSDVAVWKKANTLLRYFPGSIREMESS